MIRALERFCYTLLLISACSANRDDYQPPSDSEVNQVISVILRDSAFRHPNVAVSETLKRAKIGFFDIHGSDPLLEPSETVVRFNSLTYQNNKYFKLSDTSYLIHQNRDESHYLVSSKINTGIRFTNLTITDISARRHQLQPPLDSLEKSIYFLSIPVFSKDRKSAYVAVTYYCGPDCAWGEGYFLIFNKGIWILEAKIGTWRS